MPSYAGRWSALSITEMRYLWSLRIYTRKQFYENYQFQVDRFGDADWTMKVMKEKLRAHQYRCSITHRKKKFKGGKLRNMHSQFDKFESVFHRSTNTTCITLTGRWLWKPRCPVCNKLLMLMKFIFYGERPYVFDICFHCLYAKLYTQDEGQKADNPEYATLRSKRKPKVKKPIPKFGDDLSKFR